MLYKSGRGSISFHFNFCAPCSKNCAVPFIHCIRILGFLRFHSIMESSSNNADQQPSSNRELLRPRYAVRSRRQIQATVLPPVNEIQEISHRRGSTRTPRPRLRIGGRTSASRPVEADQAEQPVNPQHTVSAASH
jgi:hypothetical protein